MPGYTPQSEIQRRQDLIETLGRRSDKPGFGGLFDAFRGGREQRSLADAQGQNEQIQSAETQALINSMKQGGLQGPPTAGGQPPELQFQTPGLQNIQLQQAMSGQNTAQKQQDELAKIEARGAAAGGEFGASPIYGRDANGNVVVMQTNKGGGVRLAETPEGISINQPGSIAGSDVKSIGEVGAADTDVVVDKQTRLADAAYQQELNLDINRRSEALETSTQKQGLVGDWIDEAIAGANNWTTGFFGTALEYIPGTDAYDLVATVDSIKANVGFDKLQKMRADSPTGGALGQVSDFENRLLQATLGNLENSQSKGQFVRNLNELKYQLDQIVNKGISSFERDYGAPTGSITEQADAILRGN